MPPNARLSDRDPGVPAWDDLPDDQRRLFVRHTETYAAVLDCADQNVGRLVAEIERLGELDNTIVVFSSDNGGISSGGQGKLQPPLRWVAELAGRGRCRSRRMDRYVTDNPAVPRGPGPGVEYAASILQDVHRRRRTACELDRSWPVLLKSDGTIRTQFAHVTDVMPTVLELARVRLLDTSYGLPAQPMHGRSFANVLRDPSAASPRNE